MESLYPYPRQRRTVIILPASHRTCCFFPAVRTNEFVRVGHSRVSDDETTRMHGRAQFYARVTAWTITTHVYTRSDDSAMGGAGSHVLIIALPFIGIIAALSSPRSARSNREPVRVFSAISCLSLLARAHRSINDPTISLAHRLFSAWNFQAKVSLTTRVADIIVNSNHHSYRICQQQLHFRYSSQIFSRATNNTDFVRQNWKRIRLLTKGHRTICA